MRSAEGHGDGRIARHPGYFERGGQCRGHHRNDRRPGDPTSKSGRPRPPAPHEVFGDRFKHSPRRTATLEHVAADRIRRHAERNIELTQINRASPPAASRIELRRLGPDRRHSVSNNQSSFIAQSEQQKPAECDYGREHAQRAEFSSAASTAATGIAGVEANTGSAIAGVQQQVGTNVGNIQQTAGTAESGVETQTAAGLASAAQTGAGQIGQAYSRPRRHREPNPPRPRARRSERSRTLGAKHGQTEANAGLANANIYSSSLGAVGSAQPTRSSPRPRPTSTSTARQRPISALSTIRSPAPSPGFRVSQWT